MERGKSEKNRGGRSPDNETAERKENGSKIMDSFSEIGFYALVLLRF
jgi:hypothetical protein